MKKKVNGKVIEIDNMELFEKAFEGMAIDSRNNSNIENNIWMKR